MCATKYTFKYNRYFGEKKITKTKSNIIVQKIASAFPLKFTKGTID